MGGFMKKSTIICFLTVFFIACLPLKAGEYKPKKTLKDDISEVTLIKGYKDKHPRLLFNSADISAFKERAENQKILWDNVLTQAGSLNKSLPTSEEVKLGGKYWRIEYVLSGSMAYFVTKDKKFRDGAVKWMVAHCEVDTWGTKFNSNHDLEASWYLYYISLAYDILYNDLSAGERETIEKGLILHAEAIYDYMKTEPKDGYRYDQNHTYIPTIALITAALALDNKVKAASDWLNLGNAVVKRSRYVLGPDGFYYEGYGYWKYAMHWHVRYADMLTRATGEDMFNLPLFKNNYLFALHLSLPASPFSFDISDNGSGANNRPPSSPFAWCAMLYRFAGVFNDGKMKAVADKIAGMSSDANDPGMYFLWYADKVKAAPMEEMPPYHYFSDQDFVGWRSSWEDDATIYLFRSGPPEGHAANSKLKEFKDWIMNAGHVHPDIGSFWIYAKGAYLAVDTGYTANKWTKDHNTILVDGKGQGDDGTYHNERLMPYKKFNEVSIKKQFLSKDYGYASGDISGAYMKGDLGKLSLLRHLVMTKNYLLVFDILSGEKQHEYTWINHSDKEYKKESGYYVTENGKARLLTFTLLPADFKAETGVATVMGGTAPGAGKKEDRGFELTLQTEKAGSTVFLNVLVPLAKEEKNPLSVKGSADKKSVTVEFVWYTGLKEKVTLDLDWAQSEAAGPVIFSK